MEVPARELGSGVDRIDLRPRHRPDRWLARAIPTNQHTSGGRGVAQRHGMAAQPTARLAAVHPPTLEKLFDAIGEVFEFQRAGQERLAFVRR